MINMAMMVSAQNMLGKAEIMVTNVSSLQLSTKYVIFLEKFHELILHFGLGIICRDRLFRVVHFCNLF